jgi:hypothetical protein
MLLSLCNALEAKPTQAEFADVHSLLRTDA